MAPKKAATFSEGKQASCPTSPTFLDLRSAMTGKSRLVGQLRCASRFNAVFAGTLKTSGVCSQFIHDLDHSNQGLYHVGARASHI